MATRRKNTKLAKRRRLMKKIEEKSFKLNDGKKISSIHGLANALDGMDEKTFKNHVSEEKNDFSLWVGDVFGEQKLAGALSKTKDKQMAQIIVLKHLIKSFT